LLIVDIVITYENSSEQEVDVSSMNHLRLLKRAGTKVGPDQLGSLISIRIAPIVVCHVLE